jgi:hypothetical protein
VSSRYFQGTSVLGPVKASTARSFREVVDTLRICPVLGITRSAFLALDRDERNEVKKVPFFVPACFKQSPSRRVYSEATHCNLIFLDIDPEKKKGPGGKQIETGKCPAAPFVNNPESLYQALDGLNFAAHLTASSTPEKPRMRIVIDAEGIPLNLYVRAVVTVGMMLGLTVTTESKVAVQPMFLPTLFSDSPEDEDSLIAYRIDGRAFEVSDISESATQLEFGESKYVAPVNPSLEALAFLRAPVPEITLAVAKEALDHIDPDCDFHTWTHVAMALRHQFTRLDDDAFELFNEWSSNGEKYGGEAETRRKWKYVNPTSNGRLPITVRSLLREAVNGGWDDKKVKETCFNNVVEWIEKAPTVTELMEQGPKKILAAPLLSAVQEDVLVHMLCKQAKKRFAYTISTTAIRKDLSRVKADIKAQEKPAERIKEPLWAKGVCYITSSQEFYRHRTGEKYKAEAFNSAYSRWLLPTEDDAKESGDNPNSAKPVVSPSDYALNHLKIPVVYDYAYDPSQPTDMFFVERGRKFVNTYSPSYPELDRSGSDIAGIVFQKHLRNLVAEAEYRRILTDFMAFMVQFPGRKIRWAVLIQSVEGAGKTFLAEVMKAILGIEHVKTISDGAIQSWYNDWGFGAQLVVLEEIRVIGTNRHQIMNALKPLITNDQITINEKFRSIRNTWNCANYMAYSNYADAIVVTPGDRRWFVIKSPLQHKSQVLALGESYFPNLFKMLRDNAGALRAYFAEHEISEDFRADGHAPRTKYVEELINDTAGDLTAAVRRLVLEGDYPLVQFDIVSAKTVMDILHLEEGMNRVTSQHLASVLREEGYRQLGRFVVGSERHYIWIRAGVNEHTAVSTALERVRKNSKNLQMQLVYG